VAERARFDDAAEADLERLIEAVSSLRRYRDEVGARAGAAVRGRMLADGYDNVRDQIARLGRFEWVEADASNGDVLATVPIPGGGVQILPSEAFDAEEALARIEKRRQHLLGEVERAQRKLANENFVAKAPADVVDQERRKLDEYREALRRLDGP
jgi:valyl-tRNA synthetase